MTPPTTTDTNSELSPTLRATLWMAVAAVLVAASAMLIRTVGQSLDTFVIVFFRNFVTVVVMAPFLFWPRPVGLIPKRPALLAARAFLGFLTMTCWFAAIIHLPTGEAVALNFTGPLFVTILAALFIGERIRLHRFMAVLIGLVGVLIILQPGFDVITFAHLLPLIAAFTMAAASVAVRRLAQSDHPNVIIFYTSLLVLPMVAPFAIMHWQTPTLREWVLLIAIGVTTTFVHQCFTRAFKVAEASFVAGLSFLRLPFAILAAWLIFDEWPEGSIWLGGGIIIAANAYIAQREVQSERAAARSTDAETVREG